MIKIYTHTHSHFLAIQFKTERFKNFIAMLEIERERYRYRDRHLPPNFQAPSRKPDNFIHERRFLLHRNARNFILRSRNGVIKLFLNLRPLIPARKVNSPASPRILKIPVRCIRNVSERRRSRRPRIGREIREGVSRVCGESSRVFWVFGSWVRSVDESR